MTPDQEVSIVAMREAGYPMNFIAANHGTSLSTVKRVCSRYKIKKGSISEEAIAQARTELRKTINADGAIQEIAASIVLNTRHHYELISEKLEEALSKIELNSPEDAKTAFRSLNSYANALKLSTDAMRSAIKIDTTETFNEAELPTLAITAMTKADVEEVLRQHKLDEAELYGIDEEHEDNIVELH